MTDVDSLPGESQQTVRPRLMLVEDDPSLREALETTLAIKDISFVSFGDAESALLALPEGHWCALVSDIRLPRMSGLELLTKIREQNPEMPVVLMTAFADAQTAVHALKGGARDFLMKPFKADQFLEVIRRYIPTENEEARLLEGPIAVDSASKRLIQTLGRVAKTDASVLLLGESGVGKEVMAQFLHKQSHRHKHSFVAINCAAIPGSLLEATLFGHERGSFTGASKAQQGKFELAQGGTIFLDEIGEMALELQTKLLRVLQERQVERVGSHITISLDVRVIAATNQDLGKKVKAGLFREDLYYRINVFPVKIPPLRERLEDIIPLTERFLLKYRASMGQPEARLSNEARDRLRRYQWPGNVRELENAVQRALLLCDGVWLRPEHFALDFDSDRLTPSDSVRTFESEPASVDAFPSTHDSSLKTSSSSLDAASHLDSVNGGSPGSLAKGSAPPIDPIGFENPKLADVKSMEREHILQVLQQVGGNRKRAIELLGISERTLRYKLKLWREEGFKIP
jgi:two-component system response regulator FlrC